MHPQYSPAIVARFWSRVDKSGECWLWTGPTNGKYGVFIVGTTHYYAHRFAEELKRGPLPDGIFGLHDCPDGDNPLCVRHTWRGTHGDNMRDMVAKGRSLVGDRNPTRQMRERVARGDGHWSRRNPSKVLRGERHGNARLTAEIVIAIRTIYAKGGISMRQVAEQFGVSTSRVKEIVHRTAWKHV